MKKVWRTVLSLSVFLAASAATHAADPNLTLLWPQGAPGAKGDAPADRPTLTAYLPDAKLATGAAVVVCPGGGYGMLAADYEGHQFGAWFNAIGAAAFVLEYRHSGRGYGHPAPLQDAQRAIRTVRAHAVEWKVDPNRIGIMGFSAGGHLASTAGTHFDAGNPKSNDPIERQSCRPDFLILCYPVIMFDSPYTHHGSQENLLGKNANAALVQSLSNEKQVTNQTPPTFLFHTDADQAVPVENSIAFYTALHKAGVPAELHIFRNGPHGVGLAPNIPGTSEWPACLKKWMESQNLLHR